MSQEVELKFELDESSIEYLLSFLQTQTIHEQHSLHLTNTYYDRKDNILRNHGLSVRIRGTHEAGKQDEYEITVKSSGQAVAGLHARKEFNARLPYRRLDLSLLPAEVFADELDVATLSQQIIAIFTTDFHRQTWLIDFKQSKIEVALDQGKISAAQLSVPIFELELELKTGSQFDLILFALALSRFNVHLFSQSKAARGYRLLQGKAINKAVLPTSANTVSLADLLQYWQTNEEYALANHDTVIYQQTLHWAAERLQHLLPTAQNEYSTQLNQLYRYWNKKRQLMSDIKMFAFSEINTQFKLYLILLSLND
ncbi:triphosphatase [Orbus hercynius]|uniref:Triphosphatase n=1 Tax=Orbus hercynius TaxID=593135 RepID=A0A495RCV0_9GAMM|nr:CYTH domain-containing protein [Orbus hercynius]RKS85179.1 triphosphatase [Orbus hercynius]